jgi:hypothetical protein
VQLITVGGDDQPVARVSFPGKHEKTHVTPLVKLSRSYPRATC